MSILHSNDDLRECILSQSESAPPLDFPLEEVVPGHVNMYKAYTKSCTHKVIDYNKHSMSILE